MSHFINLDQQLLKWAYTRPFKRTLFIQFLIFIGDAPIWMVLAVVAAFIGQVFQLTDFENLATLLIIGFIISDLTFGQLKRRVNRRRPYANNQLQQQLNLTIENRDPGHGSKELESFPSGHVLWTTLCVSLTCFQFGLVAVLLLGWLIPSMLFLRPFLGVHYPSDTVAGLVLGGINVLLTLAVAPYVIEFTNSLKIYPGFVFGYGAFMLMFLMVGFKSWLKRV